jgi:hypothetical protein
MKEHALFIKLGEDPVSKEEACQLHMNFFNQLPNVQFGQYPESLEYYLPWSQDAQKTCK